MPGQSTGIHDHGESSGAFVVAAGILEERRPGDRPREIPPSKSRPFGHDYVHDVRNASLAPAVSMHAYSPPLTDMNEYELDGNLLVLRERASKPSEKLARESHAQLWKPANRADALSIDQMLSAGTCPIATDGSERGL